jgi:hypothetical protein
MATCRTCVEQNCCEAYGACGGDATCVEASECFRSCDYFVPSCTDACEARYGSNPAFRRVLDCTASACTASCVPSGRCLELLQCCVLADASEERTTCVGLAASDDRDTCEGALDILGTACQGGG